MNILFVYDHKIIPTYGGVERVTYLLSKEFRKRGHKVCFLSVGPTKKNGRDVALEFSQDHLPVFEMAREDFIEKYHGLLTSQKIDVAVFQSHMHEVVTAMELTPKTVKKMSVLHYKPFTFLHKERYVNLKTPNKGLSFKEIIKKYFAIAAPGIFRKLYVRKSSNNYMRMLEASERLILLSERFIPAFDRPFFKNHAEKIVAINNPVTFDPPGVLNTNDKENIVLALGRFNNTQKNFTGFINVWKLFSKENPEWKAIVVGDGEHAEMIKKYAKRKKIKNLEFVGSTNNVEQYYKKAKIFCMTSAYEGWGMVLVEAMAYGTVPVAYDSYESLKDIIDNEINGIIIPWQDEVKMAAALGMLATDEKIRSQMAQAAKEKIKKFSIEEIADLWESKIIRDKG